MNLMTMKRILAALTKEKFKIILIIRFTRVSTVSKYKNSIKAEISDFNVLKPFNVNLQTLPRQNAKIFQFLPPIMDAIPLRRPMTLTLM